LQSPRSCFAIPCMWQDARDSICYGLSQTMQAQALEV